MEEIFLSDEAEKDRIRKMSRDYNESIASDVGKTQLAAGDEVEYRVDVVFSDDEGTLVSRMSAWNASQGQIDHVEPRLTLDQRRAHHESRQPNIDKKPPPPPIRRNLIFGEIQSKKSATSISRKDSTNSLVNKRDSYGSNNGSSGKDSSSRSQGSFRMQSSSESPSLPRRIPRDNSPHYITNSLPRKPKSKQSSPVIKRAETFSERAKNLLKEKQRGLSDRPLGSKVEEQDGDESLKVSALSLSQQELDSLKTESSHHNLNGSFTVVLAPGSSTQTTPSATPRPTPIHSTESVAALGKEAFKNILIARPTPAIRKDTPTSPSRFRFPIEGVDIPQSPRDVSSSSREIFVTSHQFPISRKLDSKVAEQIIKRANEMTVRLNTSKENGLQHSSSPSQARVIKKSLVSASPPVKMRYLNSSQRESPSKDDITPTTTPNRTPATIRRVDLELIGGGSVGGDGIDSISLASRKRDSPSRGVDTQTPSASYANTATSPRDVTPIAGRVQERHDVTKTVKPGYREKYPPREGSKSSPLSINSPASRTQPPPTATTATNTATTIAESTTAPVHSSGENFIKQTTPFTHTESLNIIDNTPTTIHLLKTDGSRNDTASASQHVTTSGITTLKSYQELVSGSTKLASEYVSSAELQQEIGKSRENSIQSSSRSDKKSQNRQTEVDNSIVLTTQEEAAMRSEDDVPGESTTFEHVNRSVDVETVEKHESTRQTSRGSSNNYGSLAIANLVKVGVSTAVTNADTSTLARDNEVYVDLPLHRHEPLKSQSSSVQSSAVHSVTADVKKEANVLNDVVPTSTNDDRREVNEEEVTEVKISADHNSTRRLFDSFGDIKRLNSVHSSVDQTDGPDRVSGYTEANGSNQMHGRNREHRGSTRLNTTTSDSETDSSEDSDGLMHSRHRPLYSYANSLERDDSLIDRVLRSGVLVNKGEYDATDIAEARERDRGTYSEDEGRGNVTSSTEIDLDIQNEIEDAMTPPVRLFDTRMPIRRISAPAKVVNKEIAKPLNREAAERRRVREDERLRRREAGREERMRRLVDEHDRINKDVSVPTNAVKKSNKVKRTPLTSNESSRGVDARLATPPDARHVTRITLQDTHTRNTDRSNTDHIATVIDNHSIPAGGYRPTNDNLQSHHTQTKYTSRTVETIPKTTYTRVINGPLPSGELHETLIRTPDRTFPSSSGNRYSYTAPNYGKPRLDVPNWSRERRAFTYYRPRTQARPTMIHDRVVSPATPTMLRHTTTTSTSNNGYSSGRSVHSPAVQEVAIDPDLQDADKSGKDYRITLNLNPGSSRPGW